MSGLEPFRRRLDTIDDEVARLLGERFEICREVAVYKSEHEIPMMQPDRVEQRPRRAICARRRGRPAGRFHGGLFDLLIAATCRAEDELMDRIAAARTGAGGEAP